MGRFEGRGVVVAGGSSGLGLHLAKAFIAEGARVVVSARQAEKLEAVAAEIGAIPIAADITDFESLAALAEGAREALGSVHVAVNSAGFEQQTAIRDITPETLEPMVAVQFTGAVYFMRHLASVLERGGALVTISSLTGVLVPENYAAYAGAKAGINHVTRIAASEYGPDGLRINAVAPTVIETPMRPSELSARSIPVFMFSMPEPCAMVSPSFLTTTFRASTTSPTLSPWLLTALSKFLAAVALAPSVSMM